MHLIFRKALAADVEDAVPMIFASGPDAFNYIFQDGKKGSAHDFLRYAFPLRGGEFGYDNHIVADVDGKVVAIGACWSGRKNIRFAISIGWRILRFYGPQRGLQVIARGLKFEKIVRPPRKDEYAIAHLGVREDLRGNGIGSRLIKQLFLTSRAPVPAHFVLDVSDINPMARALYERLGFTETGHSPSNLNRMAVTGVKVIVPGHTRMEFISAS